MKYLLYVDGACSGNGDVKKAKASGSFAAYQLDDRENVDDSLHSQLRFDKPMHHESRFPVMPIDNGHPTNNMAEARSLFIALSWARNNGLLEKGNEVHVCMDSDLILNQIAGFYRTRDWQLKLIYKDINALLKNHEKSIGIDPRGLIHLHHISGEVMKASVIAH